MPFDVGAYRFDLKRFRKISYNLFENILRCCGYCEWIVGCRLAWRKFIVPHAGIGCHCCGGVLWFLHKMYKCELWKIKFVLRGCLDGVSTWNLLYKAWYRVVYFHRGRGEAAVTNVTTFSVRWRYRCVNNQQKFRLWHFVYMVWVIRLFIANDYCRVIYRMITESCWQEARTETVLGWKLTSELRGYTKSQKIAKLFSKSFSKKSFVTIT